MLTRLLILLLIGAALSTACQPTPPAPSPTSEPTPTLAPTETPTPAPSPTSVATPPTATPAPEVLATRLQDVAGLWIATRTGLQGGIYMELKEIGFYRMYWASSLDHVDSGKFSFAGTQFKWETASGYCSRTPTGSYEVHVTKQDDQPVQLRFSLIEDDCGDRVGLLDGATLRRAQP